MLLHIHIYIYICDNMIPNSKEQTQLLLTCASSDLHNSFQTTEEDLVILHCIQLYTLQHRFRRHTGLTYFSTILLKELSCVQHVELTYSAG